MRVTVYSTPTCPYCKQVKSFFDENKIEYADIDVSADEEQAKLMIEKSGQMGVPVVDIDGSIIIGFDKKELKKQLDL